MVKTGFEAQCGISVMKSQPLTLRTKTNTNAAQSTARGAKRCALNAGLAIVCGLPVLGLSGLLLYLLVWGFAFRIPHSAPSFIDLRTSKSEQPYYVAICAGLASNTHGFPGHNYVIWSDSLPINLAENQSRGFVPSIPTDQIPALWKRVPGALVTNASDGNLRNFDSVVVAVDQSTFERSLRQSRTWRADEFKVGSKDCVAYAHSIASAVGLNAPAPQYRYPQDFIRELKNLNLKNAAPINSKELFFNLR